MHGDKAAPRATCLNASRRQRAASAVWVSSLLQTSFIRRNANGFYLGAPSFFSPNFPCDFWPFKEFCSPQLQTYEAPCREEDQSKILQKHQQKAGELLPRGCQQNPVEQTGALSWGRDTVMAPGRKAALLFSPPGSALAVPIAVPVSRLPPAGWVLKGLPHTSPRCFSLSLSPHAPVQTSHPLTSWWPCTALGVCSGGCSGWQEAPRRPLS